MIVVTDFFPLTLLIALLCLFGVNLRTFSTVFSSLTFFSSSVLILDLALRFIYEPPFTLACYTYFIGADVSFLGIIVLFK